MIFAVERINRILLELGKLSHNPQTQVDQIVFRPAAYSDYALVNADASDWEPYALHQNWGGVDQHYWFRAKLGIPKELAGRKVVLLVKTGRGRLGCAESAVPRLYQRQGGAGAGCQPHRNPAD